MSLGSVLLISLAIVALLNFLLLVVSLFLITRVKNLTNFSKSLIGTFDSSKEAVEEQVKAQLSNKLSAIVDEYKESIESAFEQYLKKVETGADGQMRGLADFIKSQEAQITKEATSLTQKSILSTAAEIEEYKRAALSRIQEEAPKLLLLVSGKVLNRSISLADHEELVLQALREAQAQGIFSHNATNNVSTKPSKKSKGR